MGKKKIILDTNIYISFLGWQGNAERIIEKVIEGKYELIISLKQLKEIIKVLNYPKFMFKEIQKRRFISTLYNIARIIETNSKVDIITEDPDDNIILEGAIEQKIDYIISGDKHLLRLKEFNGAKIINLQTFLYNLS